MSHSFWDPKYIIFPKYIVLYSVSIPRTNNSRRVWYGTVRRRPTAAFPPRVPKLHSGGKTSSHECRKVLLTLVLRPRVSLKNDTVGTGWAAAPPSFRVAAATQGPRPRGTTSSPFSHWIFLCADFFRSASARFEQFDVRRSASRAPHEIRPQRLASNDLCRCRVPESHPLRPPRTKPREIPALAPSFSPAPTDDGAPRGHFARAPTSPVVLRTIRDHFLCRSGTNSSNKMGVKWV